MRRRALLFAPVLLWLGACPPAAEAQTLPSFRRLRSSPLIQGEFQASREAFLGEFGALRSGRSRRGVLEHASLGRWEFDAHRQQMWRSFPALSSFRHAR